MLRIRILTINFYIQFVRSPDFLSKASVDAFYCNLLLHTEGIALQGSFLHTLEFVVLHGVMQYTKGASHLLNPVCPFLLLCPKEMDERKGHRCAELVATELPHITS